MMETETLNIILSITEVILFLTLIILIVYLIISMKQFLYSLSLMEKEVVEISDKLKPVIKDMKYVTEDIKVMVDRSKVQYEKIEDLSGSLVAKGTGILNTVNKIQNIGNGILFNSINLVSALYREFKTFGNKLTNGSQLHEKSSDQL